MSATGVEIHFSSSSFRYLPVKLLDSFTTCSGVPTAKRHQKFSV
jgi:hypothetical protein